MLSIMLIIATTVAILLALESERKRRAKHRASTASLLLSIRLMPYVGTAYVRAGR